MRNDVAGRGQVPRPRRDRPTGHRRHCRGPRPASDRARGPASGADVDPGPRGHGPHGHFQSVRVSGDQASPCTSPAPPPRSLQLCCTPSLEASASEARRSRDTRRGAPPAAAAPTARPLLRGPRLHPASAGPGSPPAPPDGPSSQANAGRAGSPRSPGHGAEELVWPPEARDREGSCGAGVNSRPQSRHSNPHPEPGPRLPLPVPQDCPELPVSR